MDKPITLKEFFSILFGPAPQIVRAEYKKELLPKVSILSDGVMILEYSNGLKRQFRGECTTWKELPYMNDILHKDVMLLHQLWLYCIQWNGPFPDAHKQHKIFKSESE